MDFPKSVPSVGLVDGKFIDEDPLAGTPGSLIPSAWGNAVTLEILKVIEDGGLAPDEDDKTQLSAAIHNIVSDSAVPFATKAEAEDGTIDDKSMSPLRVFQAIAKVVKQATESAFGWLKIATLSQANTGTDDSAAITPKKLAAVLQAQTLNAGATAGTATAYVLSNIPGLTSYGFMLRLNVNFHVPSGVNPTINVNALGAKSLKQYDSTGAKVSAVTSAGLVSDIVYDGTDFVLIDPLPVALVSTVGARGAAKNLKVTTTGLSAVVTTTADEVTLENGSGNYVTLRSVSCAASFAVAGAGGIDVGSANSQNANAWYYKHLIWNPSLPVSATNPNGLLSASENGPTLPAGYTHWAPVHEVRTDGTGNKWPLPGTKIDKIFRWEPAAGTNLAIVRMMAQGIVGAVGTPTWSPISLSAFIPPNRLNIAGFLSVTSGGGVGMAAPSNNYGGINSTTNPPPCCLQHTGKGTGSGSTPFNFVVGASQTMQWASNLAGNMVVATGWEC